MTFSGVYLCSSSPRRHAILTEFNVNFKTVQNHLEDEPERWSFESPLAYAARLAHLKSTVSAASIDGWVLTADTVVTYQNEVLGKPMNEDDAFKMLSTLLGKRHQVISVCVLSNHRKKAIMYCIDYAMVYFKSVPNKDLRHYIMSKTPLDKAGAYGIQDNPSFLTHYSGDYFTVMGLPIKRLLKLFSSCGIV
ncbi:MAG: Maf family protein [Candidatus Margulisiibacteriota bacterium]